MELDHLKGLFQPKPFRDSMKINRVLFLVVFIGIEINVS